MSERKPNDVIEKCVTVVHRTFAETGNKDAAWHLGVVLEELHRARESEDAQAARIAELEATVSRVDDALAQVGRMVASFTKERKP